MNIKKLNNCCSKKVGYISFCKKNLTLYSSSYLVCSVLQVNRPWHVHLNNKHMKWKFVLIFSIFSLDANYLLYMYFQLNIDVQMIWTFFFFLFSICWVSWYALLNPWSNDLLFINGVKIILNVFWIDQVWLWWYRNDAVSIFYYYI
jgi:hypothetical protein